MLNRIIKLTPLVGSLLVFCGVLKLIIFYSHFNVRIIDYLEFQEIITSFLGDVNIIIVFGITMTLISFATINFISKKAKLPLEDLFERLLILLYPHRFKYFISFLLIIFFIYGFILYGIIGYSYLIIYLLTFCTIQMLTYLFLSKEENGKVEITSFYGILIFGISLSFSIYLFAQHDIENINKSISETTIQLENEIIHCNRSTKNIYIGKSSEYVFIKVDSSNSTLVIPSEEVLKYEFK